MYICEPELIQIWHFHFQGGYMFGHPGAGGQMAYADPEGELGWTYLTNHMSVYGGGDYIRYLELEEAMYKALDQMRKS